MLLWLCYTLTAYSQVSSHCYVVENFQSVCTQTTPNRKFTISFTIKVQLSFLASINAQSLAAVTIASMSGGSISVSQVALQNNQANVSFTYDEATVSPMLILRLGFTNGQNEVCRAASNFNLSSCVPAANCNQTLAFNPVMASVLTNALASYQGETASFMAGLQTGPGNDKVKAITYETTNVKRIIKSPGQPDKIIDWGLIPLVAEHFQKTPSDYKWISMSSAQLIFPGGRDFSANAKGDKLWGAMFYMPPAIAGCKEEFTFNLKAIVEFENGCIKEQVFANQKITR